MTTTYQIEGTMSAADKADLVELLKTLEQKLTRNLLKNMYYDMKNTLKDMGVAIPPELTSFASVVGWPKKAVDALANRSIFEGFVCDDEEIGKEVATVLEQNRFDMLCRQGTRSELIHSCAFFTISKGDTAKGEPAVIVSAYSAENAAGIWDHRQKRLKAGLTVIARDKKNSSKPSQIYFRTDTHVYELKSSGGRWTVVDTVKHSMGRPPMEVFAYDPTIDRPFGRSRINRSVMDIADAAMRASLRAELAAEFFTTPQKYILGIQSDAFDKKSPLEAYIGHILAIGSNEDGEMPKVGQFDPMSMGPHTEYMKTLATRFAGETSLPVSSLGVVQDNPASAEAIYASKEELVIEAQNLNSSNAAALKNICYMVLAQLQGKSFNEIVKQYGRTIRPKFKSPAMPSIVSQSDAIVKQVAAMPWLAETRIVLEELGYSESQIVQMLEEKRRSNARVALLGSLSTSEVVEENEL